MLITHFRLGTLVRRQAMVYGKLFVPIIGGIRLTLNPWVIYLFYSSKGLYQEKRLLIVHFRSGTPACHQVVVNGKMHVQMEGKISTNLIKCFLYWLYKTGHKSYAYNAHGIVNTNRRATVSKVHGSCSKSLARLNVPARVNN